MNHALSRQEQELHFGTRDNRDVPCNIVAEQCLLGAILVNNEALSRAGMTGIAAADFYDPLHRKIFEAMSKGIKEGKRINPVTIRSFLAPDVVTSMVGDLTVAQYLARLSVEAVTVINAPDYAHEIILSAQRRAGLGAAEIATGAAFNAEDELSYIDQIREAKERLESVLRVLEGNDDQDGGFRDAVDGTLDVTADAMAGRVPVGLDPGIPELYALTGPWQKGQLIIIGGDVKTGKSALAWQTFFNIAERHPVAGNSGEMPRSQIIMREKARRTGISAKRQKLGRISDVEMNELVRAGVEMKKLQHIDIDCRQLTLDQIDQRIERLQGEFGIEAFFVDHLLKLAWTGKMEDADDFKKANRATSTLKNIAMKRNICIVALTHINKGSNSDTYGRTFRDRLHTAMNRRPTFKSMLGNIDKDADNMIITHQAKPAVAALEPEAGTEDYALWEAAMDSVAGKAELILALSRENEFPRRKEIRWNGATTSYGPDFKQAMNARELF